MYAGVYLCVCVCVCVCARARAGACVCIRDVSEEAMKMLLHRSNAHDEYLELMLLTTGSGFRLSGLGFRL